ncbi:hypothetical protein [Psychromonas antarctica]|uniref:hypothetical protein n=1 Tax=Psychromonas antarctica TaxID=67573 RepID=UPI001EE82CCA|nr:hypothetical protein [Psychromonas antarctica]MCG6200879.1 hypothetical protein [Psychromonas antarctica]
MTLDGGLAESKKLLVKFRMEPGSLGPNGSDYIKEFCEFAQQQLQACASTNIIWSIEPRLDKTLTEMEFYILSKKLPRSKAEQYLTIFGQNLDDFEEQLADNLESLINQYFGR